GAHAPLLAADPGLLQPVPQAPAAAAPRLAPIARYDAAVARPLFAADRRPHPFVLDASAGGDEARGNGFDYMLTSVLIAPPLQMAILQPTGGGEGIRVRLGESSKAFPDWRLVELDPRSAVLEGPGGRRAARRRRRPRRGRRPQRAGGRRPYPAGCNGRRRRSAGASRRGARRCDGKPTTPARPARNP